MRSTRILPPAAALAALALLAGCGGTPTVKQSDVEEKISSGLEAKVGQKPDDISCPGNLKGKVGEKMRCTLTADSQEYGVSVKVTKVDGKKVGFDFVVDQKPRASS